MATTYDTSPYDEYYQDRLQWDADNKKAVTDAKLALKSVIHLRMH